MMKVRYLKPGETGPEFSFPVVYETDRGIYIQIEHEGKSYTFDLRQQEDSLTIRAKDVSIVVLPVGGSMIAVKGPQDRPGFYEEREGESNEIH